MVHLTKRSKAPPGGRSGVVRKVARMSHQPERPQTTSDAAEDVPDVAQDAPRDVEMDPIIEEAFLAKVERALFASGADKAKPSTYRQAMKRPDADQWQKAAEEEMEAHARNYTWDIVPLPEGSKAIGFQGGTQHGWLCRTLQGHIKWRHEVLC